MSKSFLVFEGNFQSVSIVFQVGYYFHKLDYANNCLYFDLVFQKFRNIRDNAFSLDAVEFELAVRENFADYYMSYKNYFLSDKRNSYFCTETDNWFIYIVFENRIYFQFSYCLFLLSKFFQITFILTTLANSLYFNLKKKHSWFFLSVKSLVHWANITRNE